MLGGRVKPSQLRPKVDVAEVTRIVKSPTKTGMSLIMFFLYPSHCQSKPHRLSTVYQYIDVEIMVELIFIENRRRLRG